MTTVFRFFNMYAFWFLICSSPTCFAGDTLKAGQKIIGDDTNLVSAGKIFELGFFTPSITGGSQNYLGIWYRMQEGLEQPQKQIVVWVANRDNPVAVGSTGVFKIAGDGNLVVEDTSGNNKTYWSSNSSSKSKVKVFSNSSPKNMILKLMDSGNLVLYDDEDKEVKLWESFENPSDTFLPGMKMDRNLKLTSWKGDDDPGSGNFSFKMEGIGGIRFIILNRDQIYWESEFYETRNYKVNNDKLDDISSEVYSLLTNFSLLRWQYGNTRLFLDSTGMIQLADVNLLEVEPSGRWKQPKTNCLRYNYCGNFASCNDNDGDSPCKCLPGFDNDNLGDGDYPLLDEASCTRRKSAPCTGNDTAFLNLTMIKTGRPDIKKMVEYEENCTSMCVGMCPQCQAYSYAPLPTEHQRTANNPSNCWIWTHNLTTLKENYTNWEDDRRLYVLVDKSDIAPTPRTCEPCGTNIVPYPLSTGSKCGDPRYFNFRCNTSMGQLSFSNNTNNTNNTNSNINYRVIRVNPSSRTFTIYQEVKDSLINRYCEGSKSVGNLKVSSPFGLSSDQLCSKQVEVSWEAPSKEPICDNSADCLGWKHSTCSEGKCLCNANYHWSGEFLTCTNNSSEHGSFPNATKHSTKASSSFSLILGLTLPSVVILACIVILVYVCRRRIALMVKQDKESIQRNIRGHFTDSERHVKDLIDMEGLEENDNEGIEVPYFDFETIVTATNNFSDANKLGKGGYGPVYKGTLQGGQEIAVKRLSSVSSQGLQEFKNEVILIAKLQHRNLVKLRGYCIKGEEKILLYEYMPNKSLDLLIFDPAKSIILDWPMRFDIILGIARGLLYLHQDSRLRVIHRDLKTSNILLDKEMQPKISDFGLARIFGGKETEANTERVVGTYGYMSPEYALEGQFSTKSDVFSFGVVLLEIISGKKNMGFHRTREISSLLGYAWTLWREEKLQDLMDSSLCDTYDAYQIIRCSQIGLLCVQDEPDDRPHMSNVVTMLDNETTFLSVPKQPTFFTRKNLSNTASSSVQLESSIQEGR
ncbi:G-type lectin S-receptor-like serine/threonine-protein kinase At4g03230 isoform X2 [Vicia villosa]|uniref:G-type lectin S-receptor-like serine/threonine-protein kinase At4g03230 isoform X2 n=1 Tax=Vicia villosa TaxID=3911 RepID=UPI00273A815D|nr:G-type lectin S-receptor-like serine/threonine-protein kinase At4g03230 isoform X2 [Vicia villosa]